MELPGIKTKAEFKKWLKTYYLETGQEFRVRWSSSSCTSSALYRANLVCVHSTFDKARSGPASQTDCPVEMKVHIRAANGSSDTACKVQVYGEHNHPVKRADSKYKRVANVTKDRFVELFQLGHTPFQAMQIHKREMMEKYGDEYLHHVADRSLCPDMNWVYALGKQCAAKDLKNFEESSSDKLLVSVLSYVEKLRKGGHTVEMGMVESEFFVVIMTDLSERVHLLESTGQLVFFHKLGIIVDVHKKCKVYLMMTNSAVGGLPLGFFILGSDSERLMIEALLAYRELLPNDAFGGRGALGPQIFITDNCKSNCNALGIAFPNSTLLLSIFDLLESTWRWLWNNNHSIVRQDKWELFKNVYSLVRCESASDLEQCFQSCVSKEMAKKYPTYVYFLKKLYESSQDWALSFHECFEAKGIGGPIVDVNFNVLKDKVFFKVRLYAIDRLLDFLVNNLNKYYQRKIIYIMNDQYEEFLEATYNGPKTSDLKVTEINDSLFNVASSEEKVLHKVVYFLGRCECPIGSVGGPCKHQHAVALQQNKESPNCFPGSAEEKKILCWAATGFFSEDTEVYQSLVNLSTLSRGLEVEDVVPDVAHEIDVEMEMYSEIDQMHSISSNASSKEELVESMMSEIARTVMNYMQNADDSFYQSLVKFHEAFKTASNTTDSMHNFLCTYNGNSSPNGNMIYLLRSPVPIMNYTIPVGKVPIPPANVRETMKAEPNGSKRFQTDEHGYAAQPKRKK